MTSRLCACLVAEDGPVFHYRDSRTGRYVERIAGVVEPLSLFQATGVAPSAINTLYQLAAARDAGYLGDDVVLRLVPDLLRHWLADGATGAERTIASTTQLLDVRTGDWRWDVIERLGFPRSLFPTVISAGSDVRPLASEVASVAGLTGDVAVVPVASHDTASAAAAVAARDSIWISSGTWSVVGRTSTVPLISSGAFATGITNERGLDDCFLNAINLTGLWVLQECVRAWQTSGERWSETEFVRAVAHGRACLFDISDPSLHVPGSMPRRVAALIECEAQAPPTDKSSIIRSIVASLAVAHAKAVATLSVQSGTAPALIRIVGGGSRNGLLCRLTAAYTGIPVSAGPSEATVVGNVLAQAEAVGVIDSDDADSIVHDSFEISVYNPQSSDPLLETLPPQGEIRQVGVRRTKARDGVRA